MLPQYDWWVWNALEILLRAWGICISLSCIVASMMMCDSGTSLAVFMALAMMLDFFLLTVALVIRHWTLGVVTASIPVVLILLSILLTSGLTGYFVLAIMLAVEYFFHPARSMYKFSFEEQSRGFMPVDPGPETCEYKAAPFLA
jgi:hypothetical protein